jgi:enoyl-CoA hydratase
VVPAATLFAEARTLAAALADKPPLAAQYILEAVTRGQSVPFDQAQFLEATLFGLAIATDDMREGTAAFLEKRKPVFRGA